MRCLHLKTHRNGHGIPARDPNTKSNEAVYRTAPATPGLLIMRIYMFKMLLNTPGMTEQVKKRLGTATNFFGKRDTIAERCLK